MGLTRELRNVKDCIVGLQGATRELQGAHKGLTRENVMRDASIPGRRLRADGNELVSSRS